MRRSLITVLVTLVLAATSTGAVVLTTSASAASVWSPSTSSTVWYSLASGTNTGLRVDVRGARLANYTAVQQYTSNGTTSQQFGFRSAGNGYYRIVTKLSDSGSRQYLNVKQAGKANGTKVETLVYATGYQQQWKIYNLGSGYVKIVPRHITSKCLDVPGASKKSGIQLQIYTCNGTASQKFKVARTSSRMWYSSSTCPNLVVFGVRGSKERQSAGAISGFGDNVSLSARETIRQVKRTGSYRFKAITYPADMSSIESYFRSVSVGAADLKKQVHGVTSKCGSGTRYALIGYSQGAHVIRDAVDTLNSTSRARIAALGLIADPTRRGSNLKKREVGLIEDFGTGPLKSGLIVESSRGTSSCQSDCEYVAYSYSRYLTEASRKVATICQSADKVCNGGSITVSTGIWAGFWASKDHVDYYKSRAGQIGSLIRLMLAGNGFK